MDVVSFKKEGVKEKVQWLKDNPKINREDYYEELKGKAKAFGCWTKIFILYEKSKNEKIINEIFDNLIEKASHDGDISIIDSFTENLSKFPGIATIKENLAKKAAALKQTKKTTP
ncbi:MAG: hypothetical protein WCG91_03695 [Candidatus Shapirobacteria bacterium]